MGEEHRVFLVDYIDKKPSLTLDEIMDGLSAQFMDLSISKTAVYNFMKEKCRISLKKAHFHSVERVYQRTLKGDTNGLEDGWRPIWTISVTVYLSTKLLFIST